jgi:5-formyltetrahydrofolate cyclo-ligase
MGETVQAKNTLRQQMRTLRRALSPEERDRASKIIAAKLINDSAVTDALDPLEHDNTVAVYLASPDEINLSDLISHLLEFGVRVVAPRWNGETYELATLRSLSENDLRRGPQNILEPAEANVVDPSEVTMWIVPGLAFTKDGKRLGYGGGWYDRLLSSAAKWSVKIGVAHEFQIVETLPHEPHDILLNRVVAITL